MATYKEYSREKAIKVLINPVFFGNSPIGFFDGAANENHSGVGVMIKVTSNHHYKAFMAGRRGSNNRVELIALWSLLFLLSG